MEKQQLRYIRTTLWCTSNLVIHYYSSGSLLLHTLTIRKKNARVPLSRPKRPSARPNPTFLQLYYYYIQQQGSSPYYSPQSANFCNSKQTPKYVISWPSESAAAVSNFMKQHTNTKQLLLFFFLSTSFPFFHSSPPNVELDTVTPLKKMNPPNKQTS